jgi:hypothetical protein
MWLPLAILLVIQAVSLLADSLKGSVAHTGHNYSIGSKVNSRRKLHSFEAAKQDAQQTITGVLSQPLSEAAAAAKGKLFYMYELEEKYWWRWPVPGTDCSQNGYVGHEHAELSGMGTSLRPEDGLYLTWHFSLFSSLFNRMKRSKRRTLDPEKASLFIIPYDLGLDGYLNAQRCTNSRRCTDGFPQQLSKFLQNNTYWQRHEGADHAVLWSLGQYHPWPHNGCDIFMRDFCKKCTFTCYWMDSTKPESRFISVPFPSAYHWSDSVVNVPWSLLNIPNRTMVAVYLGSTQTLNPAHTKIRRAMTAQCNASATCHWMQIAHTSTDQNIGDFLSVYKRAVFCLCPPGDDPARKAVFDSIISGCIPVIFQKETLYNQYPWHIGEEDALEISVSLPGALVRAGKLDFMSVLLNIPPSVIRAKQEAIARVAPRVQYAIPPEALLKDRFDSTVWEPAFPDAVDATLDGMFQRVERLLNNQSTNIPTPFMLQKAWHQQYDVVIVKVPAKNAKSTTLSSSSLSPAEAATREPASSFPIKMATDSTSLVDPTHLKHSGNHISGAREPKSSRNSAAAHSSTSQADSEIPQRSRGFRTGKDPW